MAPRELTVLVALAGVALCDASAGEAVLDEVIVTARKRPESLQDVPASVLVVSGETVSARAITQLEELSASIPAVTIAQSPVGNFVFIRGIGSTGSNQGIEQSVSVFHDGVYMGRHQLSRAPFMDIERVEVLRGPQSILFGKNTIGGAVQVITAEPTGEFEGLVSGLYGWDDGETEFNGMISGPLSDRVRGRLAIRAYMLDGYLDNVMTGDDGPEREDWTGRARLAWDVTDDLTISAKYERSDFGRDQQSTQLNINDPFTAGAAQLDALNRSLVAAASGGSGAERYDDERAVDNDGGRLLGTILPQFAGVPGFPDLAERSDNQMDLASLAVELAVGEHTLNALTAYAHYDYRDICDCDFSALPLIQIDAREDYDQWSQELRLASPGGETVNYVIGGYYQSADLAYSADDAFGTHLLNALAPNVARSYTFDQDQVQWALFGSLTWNFTDRTRASFGLRYIAEDKQVDHTLAKRLSGGWDFSAFAGLPPGTLAFGSTPADYDALQASAPALATLLDSLLWEPALGTFEHNIRGRDRREKFWSWSLSLEHDLNDAIVLFATAATGTKGGGFDARFLKTTDDASFEYGAEDAIDYELGMKSTLLEGLLTLNAVAFRTTVEDYQVSIFDGQTAFFVDNVAKLRAQGIEIDLRWLARDNLQIGLAGSYLDNEYRNFPNSPCWAIETVTDPVGCVDGKDVSGEPNSFSPTWAFNLSFDFFTPVGDDLEARALLNLDYNDDYFTAADLDPVYGRQESFVMLDLRLGLGDRDGRWEVALIGKNLTDKLIGNNRNDQPLVPGNGAASTDRPRSFALQASYRF